MRSDEARWIGVGASYGGLNKEYECSGCGYKIGWKMRWKYDASPLYSDEDLLHYCPKCGRRIVNRKAGVADDS